MYTTHDVSKIQPVSPLGMITSMITTCCEQCRGGQPTCLVQPTMSSFTLHGISKVKHFRFQIFG